MPPRMRKPLAKAQRVTNHNLATLRKRIASAPTGPGVYRWLNEEKTVLYVGKAKNLRNRLRSYVAKETAVGPWKQSFLEQIADFEVTVTNTEIEALIFETNLIKELRPKYNVLMKDDKNYIYARVTVQDPYPRVEAARKIEEDGAKYFGPMSTGGELWAMLTMLRSLFPFRTCKMEIELAPPSPGPFPRGEKVRVAVSEKSSPLPLGDGLEVGGKEGKIPLEVVCKYKDRPTPCLDFHIGKCSAPCVGRKTPEEYFHECIEGVMQFLKGDYESVRPLIQERMKQAAIDRKFELAAQFRDYLTSLDRLENEQLITDTSGEDTDIIAVAVLSGRADVVVMQRRGGRLIGDSNFSLAGQAEDESDVLEQFIPQYYEDGMNIPEMVIISARVPDRKVLEEWLTQKRGKKTRIVLPERGRKSHLLQLAEKNVLEKARQREVKWESEKRNTENALSMLKDALGLSSVPERIEGYDISHLGGTETVGSMVVMRHGKAANDHYRSFTLRSLKKGEVDDYRALKEVLIRRLRHLAEYRDSETQGWEKQGIVFGRARKGDQVSIETVACDPFGTLKLQSINYKECFTARKEKELLAFGRLYKHPQGQLEIEHVWVHDSSRATPVGSMLVRTMLRSVKKGKIYLCTDPGMENAYAEMGFRYVIKPPALFQERLEKMRKEEPGLPEQVVMVYESNQNKVDPSLTSRPDLIVIDGGKGQLSAALDVLRELHIDVPTIGLAKREEEVFISGQTEPVTFPHDSPAKFLLMRLRDEAHRFANRHREARGHKAAKESILDEVPSIGPKTKQELLQRYGSISALRSASDEELKTFLSETQLHQLRRKL